MIRKLSKETADKIAAGEVVERPLSIVKELIENSIDASAGLITCEIGGGGKDYIRVSDDGEGIAKDEVELAFMRYATSKIRVSEDLDAIDTLGFRGEALASIAAVSKVELLSKPAAQQVGARLRIEGGEVQDLQDAACDDGTTIIVRDLFYNTPARRKFMKADNAEAALISDYLSKMALAYPDIRFRFISNGTIMYSTPGSGELKKTIMTLYSPQLAQELVKIEESSNEMNLKGYISRPSYSRPNRHRQIFFVNGRWVKSNLIEEALEEAYYDKLFEGRKPVAFLFLRLDPARIDVNIHPHKTEIRFYDEAAVRKFITESVRRSLLASQAFPDAYGYLKSASDTKANIFSSQSEDIRVGEKEFEDLRPDSDEDEENVDIKYFSLTESRRETEELFLQLREESEKSDAFKTDIFENEAVEQLEFSFSHLQFLGQVFSAYLIVRDEDKLYFIDQHAAHERVLYEKMLAGLDSDTHISQALLVPVLIHLDAAQMPEAPDKMQFLNELGFSVEQFGLSELIIKEVPAFMELGEAEDFAKNIIEARFSGLQELSSKREDLISNACKTAVKANTSISEAEALQLLESMDACENPYSCPHGRPTIVQLSLSDMERLFKRK
ncbi:MAG: DNA mismatch repair endonuclease MutL [Clostridiales bacterium]|nr:DNA mismatch repair endonuclease MutL [Clostridiales bacterium]